MSKSTCLFFMAFAIVGVHCGLDEPLVRERRQLSFPMSDGRGSVFGDFSNSYGRIGASRDLSDNGKLSGQGFVSRDFGSGTNGLGGGLQWNSDRLHGKVEVEKFAHVDPIVRAQGSATLWQPNPDTSLNLNAGISKMINTPGQPNWNTGLTFEKRF